MVLFFDKFGRMKIMTILLTHENEMFFYEKQSKKTFSFSSSFKIIRWLKAYSNNNNFSNLWGEKSNHSKISLKLTDHGMNLILV